MVEHRPLSDIIAYAILTLGIFIVAFPVYLALIASTHDAATVVGGNMPLSPGSQTLVYKVFQDGKAGADLGSSAAQSVILMIIVILLTAVQFRYVEKKVSY